MELHIQEKRKTKARILELLQISHLKQESLKQKVNTHYSPLASAKA